MVPINGEWTPFKDKQDQIDHYRLWGIISPKGTKLPPIMVTDGYFGTPEPCVVVGYQGDNWAVIELSDGHHAIHGEYLAEIQPKVKNLPRGMTFADILSDYIVIDIETTGFSSKDHEIIEISAIRYKYGQITDEYSTLIHPQGVIPAKITALTGIQNEDVADAPALVEVIPVLADFLGDLPLFGHNIKSFDAPFIRVKTGLLVDNFLVDTLHLSKEAFPLLKSHKLQDLNKALHLYDGVEHRALDDAKTTNALLWACLAPRKYENLMWKQYIKEKHSHIAQGDTTAEVRKSPTNFSGDYIVLDIETTGFDRYKDEILEIAAVRYSQKGKVVEKYHTLVRPKNAIPAKITTLTGIRDDDVKDAPNVAEVIPSLEKFLGNLPIYGHNIVTFDIPFLREQTQLPLDNDLIDTLPMARKAFPNLSSYKLSFLKEVLDLSDGLSHRALDDVFTNNALIWACKTHKKYKLEVTNGISEPQQNEQLSLLPFEPTEEQVYEMLLPKLLDVVHRNNANPDKLVLKKNKNYSSVWIDTAMAFRICCRGKKHYFSVSNAYYDMAPADTRATVNNYKADNDFQDFTFQPTTEGIIFFVDYLASVLDKAVDSVPKDFSCCSRIEECSNAKRCVNPNTDLAMGCGYRRVMKSGRIFYGRNRNVD